MSEKNPKYHEAHAAWKAGKPVLRDAAPAQGERPQVACLWCSKAKGTAHLDSSRHVTHEAPACASMDEALSRFARKANATPASPPVVPAHEGLTTHTQTCRAYSNYQPPYEDCTCGYEEQEDARRKAHKPAHEGLRAEIEQAIDGREVTARDMRHLLRRCLAALSAERTPPEREREIASFRDWVAVVYPDDDVLQAEVAKLAERGER